MLLSSGWNEITDLAREINEGKKPDMLTWDILDADSFIPPE